MTEQVDLDAIEALRRYREAELPDAGYAYLADALESTLAELRQSRSERDLHRSNYERLLIEKGAREAELRQEQERADEAANHAELALAGRRNAVDALARAEETIARARAAIGDANEWDGHGRADQLDSTRRILSGYKQNSEGNET